jgi:hypothetical protein
MEYTLPSLIEVSPEARALALFGTYFCLEMNSSF